MLRIFAAAAMICAATAQYDFQTKWFSAYIDNFNGWGLQAGSPPGAAATYQMRYLINDTWWGGPGSPIFFYTGNEGDITLFAQNTGLMWELAPAFNAAVVFAEHRYYGESMPFGDQSYNTANLGFLSSAQALADYAYFLDSLKTNLSATDSPVISFGGSYGGMLSAWFRAKYPQAVNGAIAASAPIFQFTGLTDAGAYSAVTTQTFRSANPLAPQAIFNSWGVMANLAGTQAGRDTVASAFGICGQLTNPTDVTNSVYNWLSNAIQYMAMADYPYPASFLGPMPGNPVKVATSDISNPNAAPASLLAQIRPIADVFYNYSGQAGACYNLTSLMPPGLQGDGWNVQSCGEMAMPIGQYGLPNDMFYSAPWNMSAFAQSCIAQYGTVPRPQAVRVLYGGLDLSGVSNVVYSNGDLDPWSSGGATPGRAGLKLGPGSTAVLIEGGAHHLDLRASNPADPASVVAARQTESDSITQWITDFWVQQGMAAGAVSVRAPGVRLPWE